MKYKYVYIGCFLCTLYLILQINSIDRSHFQLTLKWIFWKLYGELSGNELKGDANIAENLFLSTFS